MTNRAEYWIPIIEDRLNQVKWFKNDSHPPIQRPEGSVNIRLDFETTSQDLGIDYWLDSDNPEQVIRSALKSQVIPEAAIDLADLICNGDVSSDDYFLKALNGEVLRGREFSDVYISHVLHYIEFRPTRDSFESTLYLLFKGVE